MKNKNSVHIMMFVVVTSDGDVMSHLFIWPQTHHGGIYQVSGGGNADLDRKDCGLKTHLIIKLFTTPYKKNPMFAVRNYL